jgi:hypothetical protein
VERYDHCHGDLAGYGCARKVRLILLDGIDADQECASLLAYRPLASPVPPLGFNPFEILGICWFDLANTATQITTTPSGSNTFFTATDWDTYD